VVDDTVTYRKVLSEVVNGIDCTELLGTAVSGDIALRKLKTLQPDLILLDVCMPGMDGVKTLKEIKKLYPKIAVVMVSGVSTRDADTTIEALNCGAVDFIPKPKATGFQEGIDSITASLIPIVKSLGLVHNFPTKSKVTEQKKVVTRTAPKRKVAIPKGKFDYLLIGVSTGGPNTLRSIIPKLPANLRCPILLVQHMPPLFTASLAEHLNKKSPLQVKEAVDGEQIVAGKVYIAPGGKHMAVRRGSGVNSLLVSINDQAPVNSCKPSVDVLFRSVAINVQGNVLSLILTGMGEDGAAGVATLKRKGAYSFAQDEESCVVYGMPRAVIEKDLADEIIPLNEIANRIIEVIGVKS